MPINPNPVNWFEIPANDLARSKKFYESVFGVELAENEMGPSKMAWFPMEMGAAGSAGTLVQGPGYTPSRDGSLVYIHVPKIDVALERIGEAGGKTLMPRTAIASTASSPISRTAKATAWRCTKRRPGSAGGCMERDTCRIRACEKVR